MKIIVGDIEAEVTYKKINGIRLRINRPAAEVKISAPFHAKPDAVRDFVMTHEGWIKTQRQKMLSAPKPISARYVDGEELDFFGKKITLRIDGTRGVKAIRLSGNVLTMSLSSTASVEKRKAYFEKWLKERLLQQCRELISVWERKMKVKAANFHVRNMKTRWGSCTPNKKTIRINFSLAKKPLQCLELIIVHELVHFLEPSHNKRFYALMDKYLPEWKTAKKLLKTQM
jgi:predicted metal-dependent hydrolase